MLGSLAAVRRGNKIVTEGYAANDDDARKEINTHPPTKVYYEGRKPCLDRVLDKRAVGGSRGHKANDSAQAAFFLRTRSQYTPVWECKVNTENPLRLPINRT